MKQSVAWCWHRWSPRHSRHGRGPLGDRRHLVAAHRIAEVTPNQRLEPVRISQYRSEEIGHDQGRQVALVAGGAPGDRGCRPIHVDRRDVPCRRSGRCRASRCGADGLVAAIGTSGSTPHMSELVGDEALIVHLGDSTRAAGLRAPAAHNRASVDRPGAWDHPITAGAGKRVRRRRYPRSSPPGFGDRFVDPPFNSG